MLIMQCILKMISGSSASVERKFNGGRDTISLRRGSLKATTIRELTLFRSVLNYEDKLCTLIS